MIEVRITGKAQGKQVGQWRSSFSSKEKAFFFFFAILPLVGTMCAKAQEHLFLATYRNRRSG